MGHDTSDGRFELLLTDPTLRAALSSIGVFVSDYRTGRNLPSRLWLEQGLGSDDTGASLDWLAQVHPDDAPRVASSVQALLDGKTDSFDEVFRFRRPDESFRWVVTRGTTIDRNPDGTAAVFLGLDVDISGFKSVELQLQRQNEQLETLQDIVAVIGASLNLDDTVSRILQQTQRILPYDTATVQLLDNGRLNVIGGWGFADPEAVKELSFPHPERGSVSTAAIDARRPQSTSDVARDFPAFIHTDPAKPVRSWLGIPLVRHNEVFGLVALDSYAPDTYTDEHLRIAATVGVHMAVALENARLHDETYRMAMSDPLTGAGSRRRFQVEGRLLYETAQRDRSPLCALMLDIDRFKDVNDRFGHDVGDLILTRVAAACAEQVRGSDLFARYGGEEFVILMPGQRMRAGRALAERIRASVAALPHGEIDREVTVSIGVACTVPRRGSHLDDLVRRADGALYEAKEQGRNRVHVSG